MYSPVALGHREGDSAHALAHLDEAATAAGHQIQTPSRLRVTVLARRAEERAAAGDATGVVRDLEAAHESLAIPSEGIYFGPRNEVELGALRGACELLLGQHRQAVTTLHATAERMDPSLVAWRAAVLADQGAALARMGQVDEACGRLSAALDLARQAAAADHLHRIRGVRERDLVRWGDAAPVRQLDEQLAL